MRHRLRFVAVAALLASSLRAAEPFPADLDRYIENARREWNVPGLAIAIVQNDSVVVAKGYGVRKLGESAPVDEHTRFDIASLTKSFTAAAAGVLVDGGTVRWDDKIRDRLPSVVFADPYIDANATLRDVLSHRVAVVPANAMWYFTRYDTAEVLRRVRFLEPQGQFRADMVYWNVGYLIAGEFLAKASGTSWVDLVRSRILEPAGMRESTAGEVLGQSGNVASPHIVIDGVQHPVVPHLTINVAPAGAPGGIISTASDMARWLRVQLNDGEIDGKRIVSKAALDTMHSPQVIIQTTAAMRAARNVEHFATYGFGWNIMDYRGEPMFWHSGNADGMPCYMAILPRKKLGVVVMINTWAAPLLHGALAARILDHYLGIPSPPDTSATALTAQRRADARDAEEQKKLEAQRIRDTKPSRPTADYEGAYSDRVIGDIHIRRDGETLLLQVANGEIGTLRHWHYDTFEVEWRDPFYRAIYETFVTFTLGVSGKPERLRMTLNRDVLDAVRSNQ
jgi:CubicO group peptidase (beta-lactamase class C family)